MAYHPWTRKPTWLGLGLSAALAAGLIGCSDQTADKDTAVVVPDPSVAAPTRQAAPAASSKAAPAEADDEDATTVAGKSAPAAGTPAPVASTPAPAGNAAPAASTPAPAPVKAEGWGTLKGKVIFDGTPPAPAILQAVGKAEKDPEVCARTAPITSEKLVVNPANRGVRNVFVYLQRPSAVNADAKKAVLARRPVFDQRNCTFVPHALAVMTGETVTLKSSDSTNHNVNFQLRNLNLNPLLTPGSTQDVTPELAERAPGPVSCSIHSWMLAYWLVVDHPYFAVTDADGNFEIKDAPAGAQKIVVWQESVGYVTAPAGDSIDVKPNEATTRDFKIDPARVK